MTLKEALDKGEFVITCEFVPGRGKGGPAIEAAVKFAQEAKSSGLGIHAISLTDNPGGNPAILPDVLGAEIQKEGIDALVHFSCRDLNRNAMESRAMALARRGVNSVLVITGDYTESGYEGNAPAVFDVGSVQTIKYLKDMNAGLEVPGRKRGTTETLPATEFAVGAAVSPFKYKEEELFPQFFKLEKKVAAGADFIIPQLGYDMRKFFEIRRYMASRGLKTPVIGNVYVLSYGIGKAMAANRIPGCVVSDELLKVLEEESKADDKGKGARFERAAKMVAMFKGMGFAGVHIGGFNLKTRDFALIIERAAELDEKWEEFVPDMQFGRKGEYYMFPEPTKYTIEEPDPDPVAAIGKPRKPIPYAFSRMMHNIMFEPNPINGMMRAYFKAIPEKGILERMTHGFEWWMKRILYDCRDCGDCALGDVAFSCPMSGCAKHQRNGACGGSRDGMCEVYPEEKRCVWAMAYERMKSSGELDKMRTAYVPPRKGELEFTSAWYNFYNGRDHTGAAMAAAQEKNADA